MWKWDISLNKLARWIIEGFHYTTMSAVSCLQSLLILSTRTMRQMLHLVTSLSVSYIVITTIDFHSLNPTTCLVAIEHLVSVARIWLKRMSI